MQQMHGVCVPQIVDVEFWQQIVLVLRCLVCLLLNHPQVASHVVRVRWSARWRREDQIEVVPVLYGNCPAQALLLPVGA